MHARPVIPALLLALLALSACGRKDEVKVTTTPAASAALDGVVPSKDLTGASDHTGAPAIGAVTTDPAKADGKSGGPAQPTGGDGAASAASR